MSKAKDKGRSLREWRAAQRETIDLPSGLTVTLRRVPLADLLMIGKVPMPLLGALDQFEIPDAASPHEAIQYFQDHPEMTELIAAVVRAVLVEPLVGEVADDAHVTLEELGLSGQLAIFEWLNRGAMTLAPFPAGQGSGDRARGDGGAVRATPESDPGVG